jgi:HEAT repeat protein
MTAIEEMKQQKDVPGLIKALRHSDWKVRAAAAEALGEVGDARAVRPLERVRTGDRYSGEVVEECEDHALYAYPVKEAAEGALVRIGSRDSESFIAILRECQGGGIIPRVLSQMGSPPVELVISALRDRGQHAGWARENAAWILGEIGDASALEALTAALSDDKYLVRTTSIAALEKLWRRLELPPETLLAILKYAAHYPMQIRAAKALGEMHDTRATEPLVALLRSSNEDVRKAAAEDLESISARNQGPSE